MAKKQQLHFYNKRLKESFYWNRSPKGEVGIEIEVEGGPWPHAAEIPGNWEQHQDGSLRNNGIEYVIRQPVNRNRVEESLNDLKRSLEAAQSRLDFSYRTSVHVHVNVQDMTVRQWCSYLATFIVLEELLVDVVGPKRAGNRFCLRVMDADEGIRIVVQALRNETFQNLAGGDLKYASMNLLATATHGTLEFRAMEGNFDVKFINDWVQVLTALKDYAMKLDNPQDLMATFSLLGPNEWARSVLPAGNSITEKVLAAENAFNSMYEGARLAQDICFAVPWDRDDPVAVGQGQAPEPVRQDAPAFEDGLLRQWVGNPVPAAPPRRARVRPAPMNIFQDIPNGHIVIEDNNF